MTYDEIKQKLLNDNGAGELLESHKEIFNKIDLISNALLNKHVDDSSFLRSLEQKLIGYYDKIAPISSLIKNKLDMEQIKAYFNIKNNEKIAQKDAEKKSELMFEELSQIVETFEIYTKCIDKTLTTCQSMLKSIDSGNKASGYDR